jgi:hypothetical protein
MSIYEGISLTLSAIAIFVSITAYIRANILASGNIELYINERITNTKERVSDTTMQMAFLASKDQRTAQEEKQFEIFQHNFRTAIENNLNAYEEACAKYLDNKVDRKRFEKHYRIEIRQLVENEAMKEYFDGVTSRYRAILKVYTSWENLEK